MICSREGIETEYIVDFPVEKRFLKLPIDRLIALEKDPHGNPIELINIQNAVINAMNDPKYRFITACLSRRTGKTFVANRIAFCATLVPNTHVLIVAPDYNLSRISWDEQHKLIKLYGLEVEKDNSKDRVIEYTNGSTIRMASVGRADSAVGRSYDLILFDEAAIDSDGKEAFNIRLRPTLDKPGSKAIFISTPRGDNYFKEFYDRGFNDKFPNWVSFHSTWRDNPRASPEDIEEARRAMSPQEFRQEYEADFTSFEGQIYDSFDDDNVEDLSEREWPSERYETLMGIDPGYKDATAAVVIKYDLESDIFYFTWEYEQAARNTEQHAKAFSEQIENWDVDLVFCDSAAAQFRMDLASLYDIPSAPATKSVLDGIEYVAALVHNKKIIVDINLRKVITMFRNYRWDPRDNLLTPKPLHDEYSHLADAVRYALYSYTR